MRSFVSFVSAACCAAAMTTLVQSASAQCVTGGAGGAFTDPGDGNYDTVLPSTSFSSTLAVTVPGGATVIKSLKLNGLSHTWGGDLQFVLEAPGGAKYNITSNADNDPQINFVAVDMEIVDPMLVGPACAGGVAFFPSTAGTPATGTYAQVFGSYTSGNNGIVNANIESIPIASGNWTLYVYDWVGFDTGSLVSWDLCFGSPSSPVVTPPLPPTTCLSGAGGSWPIAGVDGTWPTVLPTGQLVSPIAVTVPAGATEIIAVKLLGYTTTWVGDQHFVLQDPSGNLYNLFYRPGSVLDSFGLACDAIGGDYTIYENGGCALGLPLSCNGLNLDAGQYEQSYGDWPSGSAGINNVALGSIPLANGTWNLIAYDWYVGFDDGAITGWELCFDLPSGPTAYCTPIGTGTTNGCIPTIGATGNPNVAHSNSCVVTVTSVEGVQSGILFYGLTPNSTPWCNAGGNSFLCVKAPLERTGVQNSGGVGGTCTGTMTLNWNAYQLANIGATGQPWAATNKAYVQGWFRDPPACKTTFLSEALELTYLP